MPTRSHNPSPFPRTDLRELYLRLMAQGMNNSQACRTVGINRRTGTRWRYGRVEKKPHGTIRVYRPIAGRQLISERFLSQDERVVIADLHRSGFSIRQIAEQLGRSPSTISREIRRNRDPATGRYQPFAAHKQAAARRPRPKARKLATESALRDYVQDGLGKQWSPEQIAGTLTVDFPDDVSMRIVPETIYRTIYDRAGVLTVERRKALRSGRIHRRPRRRHDGRQKRFPAAKGIKERPAEAAARVVPGHLEGDLIMGEGNRTAIGTLVDRCTRYIKLVHLPDGKTAAHLEQALLATLDTMPAELKCTLTWDRGSEIACHEQITTQTNIEVYLADPGSPWQRPSNENSNGLLRQYFPKHTDLSIYTAEDLEFVEARINNRPRKMHGWKSPTQVLDSIIESA